MWALLLLRMGLRRKRMRRASIRRCTEWLEWLALGARDGWVHSINSLWISKYTSSSIQITQVQCCFTPLQLYQTDTVPNSNSVQEKSIIVHQDPILQHLQQHKLEEYALRLDAPFWHHCASSKLTSLSHVPLHSRRQPLSMPRRSWMRNWTALAGEQSAWYC